MDKTGNPVSVTFLGTGTHAYTLTVQGVSDTVNTVVISVPLPNQLQWADKHPMIALSVNSLADETLAWAQANQQALGGGLSNGKADAARHAYWNAIMALDSSVGSTFAAEAATAHERRNLDDGQPHNESVMDQMNNSTGRHLAGLLFGATRTQIQAAVYKALDNGYLIYMDDPGNAKECGLLQPSNK